MINIDKLIEEEKFKLGKSECFWFNRTIKMILITDMICLKFRKISLI